MSHDVVQITRSANPVPDASVAGSVEGEEARRLLAAVTAEPAAVPRRTGTWVKFGVPAAVSMVLVIGLLAAPLLRGGQEAIPDVTSPGTGDGSPITIERIAAVAAMQPEVTLPEGGFRYTKSETRYMSTTIRSQDSYTVLESTIREIWVAENGEGRLRTEVGEVDFLSERDEQAWQAAGSPEIRRDSVSDDRFPGGDPGGTDLYFESFDGLPTDPDAMYRVVEERSRNQGITLHQQMFDTVGSLLRETNASPDIRAALFRAAAKIPGVTLTENVTDPKGRSGVALSLSYDPGGRIMRNELVFDPNTSALLAESQYVMEKSPNVNPSGRPDKPQPANGPTPAPEMDLYGDLAPGTQVGGAVYLASGIVDSVEERPAQ
jgi:hypothetical protein